MDDMMVRWLLDRHLIPSFSCCLLGAVLLVLSVAIYQIRMTKIIVLNPVRAIREYSAIERTVFIIGAFLTVLGLLGFLVISAAYDYPGFP